MEGDSDSAAIRPSSATEAAPAPGELAVIVRLECLKMAFTSPVFGQGTDKIVECARSLADFVLGRCDIGKSHAATSQVEVKD